MKSIILVGVLTIGVSVQAADSAAKKELAHKPTENPLSSEFSVVARDAHSTVWERVEYQATPDGQKVAITNQYTELANGLNFTNSTGEYVESKELIQILPEGGAAALHGQFRAWFPADISEGVIEVLTPDGMNLKSRPAAISYFNGKESVLIAELKSSLGQLLPSGNQVIWPDCFTDVGADLVVTYRKGGIECDLVFRENPPGPEQWNLGPDTRLQLLTEFFDTQEPVKEIGEAHPQSGLRDTTLRFGSVMTMTVGKAFSVGDAAVDEGTAVEPDETQVYKSWEILSDPQDPKVQRTFLIEEVPYERVEQKLKDLPTRTAKSSSPPLEGSGVGSALHRVTPGRVLPPQRLAKQGGKKMELAQANVSSKAGYVLDWVINLSSGTTYALRGDTTFYLSAPVTFSGVVIFEPGSVLKYASGASLAVGGIDWKASAYRPVVFTSKNDNSVGETVSGSTGDPSGNCYANPALQLPYGSAALSHFRIAHAQKAVQFSSAGVTLAHGQIVNCQNGVTPANASLSLKNVLFANVNTALSGLQYSSVSAENVTFAGSVNYPMTFSALASGSGPHGISLKNCILTRLSTFLSGAPPLNISGSHNGFYNTPAAPAALTSSFSPTGNPFQSAGAGNYYLTDTGFRDVGTPDINAGLLADLKKRTTYPPQDRANLTISASETWPVQAQRDNDGIIDLGFHYAPLDYMVRAVNVNSGSATLTLGEGVAVASYGHEGFITDYGAKFVSRGTAQTHNQLCFYQAVQEQPVKLNNVATYTILRWHGYQPPSRLEAQFTDFNGMAGSMIAFGFSFQCNLRDCLIGSGTLSPEGAGDNYPDGFTNNIIESATLEIGTFDYICPVYFYNNTVRNSTVSFHDDWGVNGFRTVRDNLFDNSTLWVPYPTLVNYDHNAYRLSTTALTPLHTTDLTLSALTYANGALGKYYIGSSTATLVDAGSRSAANAGLYHHTTKTSQVKEGDEPPGAGEPPEKVDIGFHYVAVDASANPVDTDQDDIPDYLEDKDGDGVVDPSETPWAPAVSISVEEPGASEIDNHVGKFRITRSWDNIGVPLTVNFQISGSAILGTDYLPIGTQVTIPAGSLLGFVEIQPLSDYLAESTETVTLTLTANPNYLLGSPVNATINITDGPSPPSHTVTVQPATSLACENNGNPGTFAICRTGGHLAAPLTVNFQLTGTADEGVGNDYQSQPHQATIPANADFTTVSIQPIADGSDEGAQSVILTPIGGPHHTIGDPGNATIHILDNCVGTDSTGKDFWVLFFNTGMEGQTVESLMISGPATTVTVAIPGHGNQNFQIVPGIVTTVPIPNDLIITDYDTIQSKGIHITAGQPVSVYGMNYDSQASDAFIAFPTSMLGMNYCVMARPSLMSGFPYQSQLAVVAMENNTIVTNQPSPTANIVGHPGTAPFTKTLQQGQTYQLQSSGFSDDITGTLITSDKRIGVFGGAQMARVPGNVLAGNQLVEQQLPVSSWGMQALGFPLAHRLNGDSYRVLAAYDNTFVKMNGMGVAILQAGQFYDAIINGPVEFQASKPIQVAQFSTGAGFGSQPGDPFEMLLPPTGHYLDSYTVSTATIDWFYLNYLNLFVEKTAISSTVVDGKLIPSSSFQAIGRSGYYGAQIEVARGPHIVSSSKPLGIQVYGFGNYDGYGYIGGVANFPLVAIADAFNVPLNKAITVDVLANDIFSSRDTVLLDILIQPAPSTGSATVTSDKRITYTPPNGFSGNAELTYRIQENGRVATSTATLMVNAPVAENDQATICSVYPPITIPVLANDSSPAGGLTVQSVAGASFGTVAINPGNPYTVTYSRFEWYQGTEPDNFTYTIVDGRGAVANAVVHVDMFAAYDDLLSVYEAQNTTLHVLDNDRVRSVDGSISDVTQGLYGGQVTISPDGKTVRYDPSSVGVGWDQFTYTVSGGGCANTATVSVMIDPVPISITVQPENRTVLNGNNATFTAAATGTPPLTYQWRDQNGTALSNGSTTPGGGIISGATTATLTLTGVHLADSDQSYYVSVSGPYGSVDSLHAVLYVAGPVAPVINTQPASRTVLAGTGVRFSVSVLSAPTTTYQWRENGVNITGETSPSLLLKNVQSAQSGNSYSVFIQNPYGSATSSGASLTVVTLANDPTDTDGDGMPDVWENFYGLAPTDASDANSDPDNDKIINLVEYQLNTYPSVVDNPLNLSGISLSGSLSGTITIPLSINSDVDDSVPLTLFVDGQEANATVENVNQTWLAYWDTTTMVNGTHSLSLKYTWQIPSDKISAFDVFGDSLSVTVNNPLTFTSLDSTFCDLLVIDAKVNNGASSYSVDVYDAATSTWLTTLPPDGPGAVTDGKIQTTWDLTDGDGNILSDGPVTCEFSLFSGSGGATIAAAGETVTKTFPKFLRNPYNNTFTVAWGADNWDSNTRSDYGVGICRSIVDTLDYPLNPGDPYYVVPAGGSGNVNEPYGDKSFNFSKDYPDSKNQLLTALRRSGNFFWVGHGNGKVITPGEPELSAKEIGSYLGNPIADTDGNKFIETPYKFVFLLACNAYSQRFADAFGIAAFTKARKVSTTPPVDVGAYLAQGRSTDTVNDYRNKKKITQVYVWPCADLVDSVGVTHEAWFS